MGYKSFEKCSKRRKLCDVNSQDMFFEERDGIPHFNCRITSSILKETLAYVYRYMNRMTRKFGAPKRIAHSATSLFKQLEDLKVQYYYSNMAKMTSCLYIVMVLESIPSTIKQLSLASGVCSEQITHCHLVIIKLLNIDMSDTDDASYMLRISKYLELNLPTTQLARKIANNALEMEFMFNTSKESLVAASIYMACQVMQIDLTQDAILEMVGVSFNQFKKVYAVLTWYASEIFLVDSEFRRNAKQVFKLPFHM
ncbi:transcription initiation factor IIB-like [Teleopsis dalmanni]|uniref:transcription initiation factor IIB-like n=1 Tax=Teleopsis dalmanni TaxID=139649 RepID=UPI0018CE4FD2|nr:transcription initiation factor IIB-like [Teleopsis dalmanni]XP_037938096.1 transcription initiation factor IIB-like [Teleopsis dalmanni]